MLTKSPLLLRDLPLMLEIAERTSFSACLSIPTLDEKAWRATEPHTPNPRARLEAVAELNRAGIPTGVLIAPLMPGINDAPHQVEPLLELAAEAGATSIGGVALHLRGEVREMFMDWLRRQRPDLVPRYEELYRRGAYAPREERERLREHGATRRDARSASGRTAPLPRAREHAAVHAARATARGRSSERAVSACRAGRAGACSTRAISAPPSAAHDARGEVGRESARAAPPRCGREGATSTSPRLRSIARTTAPATSSGRARADARGQLDAGVGEHAGVADEAGEDARDADAAAVQVGAQRGGEAAQAVLRSRCRAGLPGTRALPAIEDMNSRCPRRALDHPRQQPVREHDRRAQVDVERAVDLLDA